MKRLGAAKSGLAQPIVGKLDFHRRRFAKLDFLEISLAIAGNRSDGCDPGSALAPPWDGAGVLGGVEDELSEALSDDSVLIWSRVILPLSLARCEAVHQPPEHYVGDNRQDQCY